MFPNKLADITYNGVRREKVETAKPTLHAENIKLALTFLAERAAIYQRKELLRLPAPWTEDPILLNHKFTNVRRENDRESKLVIKGICLSPVLTMEQKVQNLTMFRMFNVWSTVELIGGPFTNFGSLDLDAIRERLKAVDGERVFTNAFNCGGLKQCLAFPDADHVNHQEQRHGAMPVKIMDLYNMHEQVMDYKPARDLAQSEPGRYTIEGWEPNMAMRVVRYLNTFFRRHPNWVKDFLACNSQKEAFLKLTEIRGISEFLGYQIFVDCSYCPEYPFSDKEFTVAGPGCKMGMDFVFEDRDGMTYEECLFWLRNNQKALFLEYLGKDPSEVLVDRPYGQRYLSVMDWENSGACEVSKYIRCHQALQRGEKPRTRVKFNGTQSPAPRPKMKVKVQSTTKSVFDI